MSDITYDVDRYYPDTERKSVGQLITEARYCHERIQSGTMTELEARAWLKAHGHDTTG